MASDADVWLKRAREVMAKGQSSHEVVSFAPSILAAPYGPSSAQLQAFNDSNGRDFPVERGGEPHEHQL
jgi:hypothetical protein